MGATTAAAFARLTERPVRTGSLDRVSGAGEVNHLTAFLDVVGRAVLVGHNWGGLLGQLGAWTRRMAAAAMFLGVGVLHRLHLADRVLRRHGKHAG